MEAVMDLLYGMIFAGVLMALFIYKTPYT